MSRDGATVLDIVTACRRVLDFTQGTTHESFATDEEKQSAVVFQIAIVGEATKRLSQAFRNANADVPWVDIATMRNRLIHQYDDIDFDLVWDTVTVSVPELLRILERLIPREPEE